MKKIILLAFVCIYTLVSANVPYRVIVPVQENTPGTMIYLVNYDNNQTVDSAAVVGEQVVFTGDVDEPWPARILADKSTIAKLIVEEGTVSVDRNKECAGGMMYNDIFKAYVDMMENTVNQFEQIESETDALKLINDYTLASEEIIEANSDNPAGYLVLIDVMPILDPAEVIALVDKYPDLKKYARVQKNYNSAKTSMATAENMPFVDFEATYGDTIERLSDYVGRGKYTLVDFWASWCGPCMREMPVIKDIYDKYADKGLEVLGVAVWDEPEASLKTIKDKNLPWHSIINTGTTATDAYGISGIPCIILFGPDGTIVSRGARGDELKAIVDKAMSNYSPKP